jgi:D-mannonate dehydratase
MQHLFSRHSFRSFGNWYQILGPAHNIYQPAVKSADMNGLPGLHSKQTLRRIRQNLLSFISFAQADEIDAVNDCLSKARQVRMQT